MYNKTMDKAILDYIRSIRKEKNITQQEMGEFLSMKTSSYGDIENGVTRIKLDDFLLICKKLEIDPIILVKNTNQIIVSLDKEQIELLEDLTNQIRSQVKLQNVNINSSGGDILIGSNIKKIK